MDGASDICFDVLRAMSISSMHGDSKIWPSRTIVSVRAKTRIQRASDTAAYIAPQMRKELTSKVR